jgi:hypothetical protein
MIRFFPLLLSGGFAVLVCSILVFASQGSEFNNPNIENIETRPKDQQSSMSKIPKEPLLFAIFTLANDSESMKVMRQQYSQNDRDHYVMQSIRSLPEPLWLYDAFPTHRKMIIVQSLDNITNAIEVGRYYNLTMIIYDIEKWEKTPELNGTDPSLLISKGADIVHQLGYKYGITPDADTLIENYKKISWNKTDFLGMQLQRYSQDTTEYSRLAEEITTFARSKNPNIEIFTQLSFRFADTNEMIELIENINEVVDGFIISYLPGPDSDSCISKCSPHELNLVLDRINELTR